MWHEARRQEKLMRARIVDCSKRAEKRRRFYDSVRKDPDQFMQIHGRKCTIHTDKSIARAAEDSNILRRWQGDPAILIDRFDVRSHLDFITPVKKKGVEPDSEDEKQEIVCDFERYRILVINDFRDISEKEYLRKIAEKEFWRIPKDDQLKTEQEKKKKSAETKASIGFNYENSIVVKKESEEVESDDDADIEEPEDIDVDLDLRGADAESQRRVNCIGEAYGIRRGSFAGLLRADAITRAENAELRRIDREKAALAGRDSKHERLLLKKQRALIVGKGCPDEATVSLLSFVESAAAQKKAIIESSSSSESEDDARPQFITTFGGDDGKDEEEEEEKPVVTGVVGPQLPTKEYRRMFDLTKRSESPDQLLLAGRGAERRSRSRSRSRTRSGSRSRSRSRSRTRDRRRSRSRSSSRSRHRSRSRSRSRERQRRSRYSRSRSRDRDYRRHSRSRSRESRKTRATPDRPLFRDHREESGHGSSNYRHEPVSKSKSTSADDYDMLEIRSSMSESEKERIEIENRKRRINRTKRMVRENRAAGAKETHPDSDEEEKKEIARKIKLKMKKALRQTVEELKEEQEEKRKEMEKERRIRDEILYVEEMERRERERERRRERRKQEDQQFDEEKDKRKRPKRSRSRSRERKHDDRSLRRTREYR